MKTFALRLILLSACLVSGVITCAHAGYSVHTKVETADGGSKTLYTWTVYNQDQAWGLDAFMLEVPVETRVLAYTVPPILPNGDGSGYWIMEERTKELRDPHDDRIIYPAPKPGMKWLAWWGEHPYSCYPPGTSATFTLTTDSSVQPAGVNTFAVTYTPQNDPHYYHPWSGSVTGPSVVRGKGEPVGKSVEHLQTFTVFTTNAPAKLDSNAVSTPDAEPVVSFNLHAGITIEGAVGRNYAIYFTDNLASTNRWHALANIKLREPKETWYDPAPATHQQRFYKVVAAPIP